VTVDRYATIGGDLGSLSIGDITVNAGKSTSVSIDDSTIAVSGDVESITIGDFNAVIGVSAALSYSPTIDISETIGDVQMGDISITAGKNAFVSYTVNIEAGEGIGDFTVGDVDVVAGASASIEYLWVTAEVTGGLGDVSVGDVSISLGKDSLVSGGFTFSADSIGTMAVGDVTIDLAAGSSLSELYFASYADNDAGNLTAGNIDLTAVDGIVTVAVPGSFGADDIGLHTNGATANLYYTLTSTADATLTVGDITVGLDTLSNVAIAISNTNAGVGNIVIGDLTVTGAVGSVSYTGGAPDAAGSFTLTFTDSGSTTIGDIDYSGYLADAVIDPGSWGVDSGAAHITGSAFDDTITGLANANSISGGAGDDVILALAGNDTLTGGTGVDTLTGGAGNDVFAFDEGDSGVTGATIDVITDFTNVAGNTDKLDFNNGTGVGHFVDELVDGDVAATDLTSFIANANDALNSTIKYYAEAFGGNTYVAVNYGSGDADMVVELQGVATAVLNGGANIQA